MLVLRTQNQLDTYIQDQIAHIASSRPDKDER